RVFERRVVVPFLRHIDEQNAARREHARVLGEELAGVAEVLEKALMEDGVEAAVREWQAESVGANTAQQVAAGLARDELQCRRRVVDHPDLGATSHELQAVTSRPGAHFENARALQRATRSRPKGAVEGGENSAAVVVDVVDRMRSQPEAFPMVLFR